MPGQIDKDTRFFIEIDRSTLRLLRCGYADKYSINRGRQTDPAIHRLFLTPGQYNKFVERCGSNLNDILDK